MLLTVVLCLFLGAPVFNLQIPPLYEKILDELSWTLKLKLLNDYISTTTTTSSTKKSRRVGMESLIMADPAEDDLAQNKGTNGKSIYAFNDEKDSMGIDLTFNRNIEDDYIAITSADNHLRNNRYLENRSARRAVQYKKTKMDPLGLLMGRRQESRLPDQALPTISVDDESNMRMKLFRLMYESVRDSDLKVKRAELIKTHYHNSSAFDIGYLMGDITDKYNVMQDIAKTLERLYNEWKPLEHINAYEQIANQGIEISHLIDMVRHINKRSNNTFLL